jgi:fructoselysine-6-P-deglycase FrlB-like protein
LINSAQQLIRYWLRNPLSRGTTGPPERLPMPAITSLGARTSAEIETQPECWASAVELAARLGADPGSGLPQPGERVLAIGCGTSYYIARAFAGLREELGAGETDALVASELPARLRAYDRVVAVSRSGTSAEVVRAIERLSEEAPVTAIVGVTDSPAAHAAQHTVDLGFADETSVVQTRFATSALALLRASAGEDLSAALSDADTAVASALPEVPERQLVVLAGGWANGLAEEAALKCRESAAAWVEAYAPGEYRHGPIAVADPTTLVWALTPLNDLQRAAITAVGATLEEGRLDPMAELVRIQRLAVEWARSRGRDADVPTNLTRSVTEA